jgi:hypothetical protein
MYRFAKRLVALALPRPHRSCASERLARQLRISDIGWREP